MGQRLRWLREQRGWTRGQLILQAQQSLLRRGNPRRLSHSTLYRYEHDERMPETWSVIALADALRTTTDFLLLRTDDPATYPAVGETPAPEDAPLLARLNRLPRERRQALTRQLTDLLDLLMGGAPHG